MTDSVRDAVKWVDLGSGHSYRFITDGEDKRLGILERHLTPDDRPCTGGVYFEGSGVKRTPLWRVVSLEPLSLEPSIQCTACAAHGWITDGRWCEA